MKIDKRTMKVLLAVISAIVAVVTGFFVLLPRLKSSGDIIDHKGDGNITKVGDVKAEGDVNIGGGQ